MIAALSENNRVLTTFIIAGVWLTIAFVGLSVQHSNDRATQRSYKFWLTAPFPTPQVLITAGMNARHNRGRLIALYFASVAGVAVLVSPFLYTIPPTPTVPAAYVIGIILEICLVAMEVLLTRISVLEFRDRKRLYKLTIPVLEPEQSSEPIHTGLVVPLSDANKLLAIAETPVVGIAVADRNGIVRAWDAALERLSGYPATATIGKNLTDTIVPVRYHEEHRAAIARYKATGISQRFGQFLPLDLHRADGTEVPVWLLLIEAGVLVTGIFRERR